LRGVKEFDPPREKPFAGTGVWRQEQGAHFRTNRFLVPVKEPLQSDGKIDHQVRTAFFNLKSSSDLVAVAKSNIDLANQTLTHAQDRFRAGVADNLEVVHAQESSGLRRH
jgi:Outer membrane efflux protein